MKRLLKISLFTLMIISLLAACSEKDDTASQKQEDAYITMAQKFIEQNDYKSALVILEEAIDLSDSKELKLLYDSVVKLSENTASTQGSDITSSLTGEWYLGGPQAFMEDLNVYISASNDNLIINGKYFNYPTSTSFEFDTNLKTSDMADGYEQLELCDNNGKTIKAEVRVINEVIGDKTASYIKCTPTHPGITAPNAEYILYNKSTGTMLEGVHLIKSYCDTSTKYLDRSSVMQGGNFLDMSLDKYKLTLNYQSIMPGSGEVAEINHVADLSALKYSDTEYNYYLEFPYTDNFGATGMVKFTFGAGNGGHMIYVDVYPSNANNQTWSIGSTMANFPLLAQ